MKYTKYNIRGIKKPKKNNNFLLLIVCCILFAFILGTLLKTLLFKGTLGDKLPTLSIDNLRKEFKFKKNNLDSKIEEKETTRMNDTEENKKEKPNEKQNEKINSNEVGTKNVDLEENDMKFYSVQCGVFKQEENAKTILNSVGNIGSSFIVKEGDLYKVINGVFEEEASNKILEDLGKTGIEGAKIKFKVKKDGGNTEEIAKILDAFIKVLNKLNEKNVKEIKTDDIKKWVSSLNNGNNNSSNYKNLESIKSYIGKLPKTLQKNDLKDNYEFLYKFLTELNKEKI